MAPEAKFIDAAAAATNEDCTLSTNSEICLLNTLCPRGEEHGRFSMGEDLNRSQEQKRDSSVAVRNALGKALQCDTSLEHT